MQPTVGLGALRKLVRPWSRGETTTLARTRILDVNETVFTSATDPDRSGSFSIIESRDFMNVVAVTPDDHIVMVEQFRYGSDCITLEPPAGIVEPGEDPMHTCVRELAEETGYTTEREIEPMGSVLTNPAIMTNRCWFGVLRDVELTEPTEPDEHEELATRLVPVAALPELIDDGVIEHALAVACIERFLRRERDGA